MGDIRGQGRGSGVIVQEMTNRLTIEPGEAPKLDRLDLALSRFNVGERCAEDAKRGRHFFLFEPEIVSRLAQTGTKTLPVGFRFCWNDLLLAHVFFPFRLVHSLTRAHLTFPLAQRINCRRRTRRRNWRRVRLVCAASPRGA